jgi:hypothetical protein
VKHSFVTLLALLGSCTLDTAPTPGGYYEQVCPDDYVNDGADAGVGKNHGDIQLENCK